MKWKRIGACAFASEDGNWIINRAPQEGYETDGLDVVFTLVEGQGSKARVAGRERFTWRDGDLEAMDKARREAQRRLLEREGLA